MFFCFPAPVDFESKLLYKRPEGVCLGMGYIKKKTLDPFEGPGIAFFKGILDEFLEPIKGQLVVHVVFKLIFYSVRKNSYFILTWFIRDNPPERENYGSFRNQMSFVQRCALG